MGHCVFMLRPDSVYDDSPAERYQFPKQYLGRAQESVGDWILYLEPRRVPNSRGYYAIARVVGISPDSSAEGLYLAQIEAGSYLEFANSVPFNEQGVPVERGLLNEYGKLSGRAQAAVRPISSADFLRIIERGLGRFDPVLPRIDFAPMPDGLSDGIEPFVFESDRERIGHFVSRPVRDRAFRRVVLRAYEEKCAFTGLKFINGGGRAEVDAAHIRPVEHNGPDTIQNGLALSGTAHWMFDRGLISLSNDHEILISRQVNDVDSVKSFINKDGKAILPKRKADWPHPHFLEWHRGNCFKA
ncbi:restriction endonuclease [Hwanghaeella grinnelliae]|uniref:Restriction endonuclease n=1 Tax=Hwanghaeella grinnelliae TaxID=2500179 RepID=A0A437QQB6_9PROT|nr:HNH endonuclease [Hwanghaeella grinnelliae]RVU36714.1 restriction endonuclease [Hwanghaeella grinnelliae]